MSCAAHVTEDKNCPFCAGLTRIDALFGRACNPEYSERLERTWYGYCRIWRTHTATGKIRIWDPFHKWEKS